MRERQPSCARLAALKVSIQTTCTHTRARRMAAPRVQKIDAGQLRNHKNYNREKLQCKQCHADGLQRVEQLRRALTRSKRVCKCFCRIHSQKCPLTPVIFGEKRWPGSDGAISADDRKWLDAQNPPPSWWSKAWGRK